MNTKILRVALLIFALAALGLAALGNNTQPASAGAPQYVTSKVTLKARTMMPAPVWKSIVVQGKKVLAPPDENFSLNVDVDIWVTNGPDPISDQAAQAAWEAYHNGIQLPAASMGWLLASGLVFNGCPAGVAPSGGPPPSQPPAGGGSGTACKGNDVNPMNPDSNPRVTLPRGVYTIEEWKVGQNWHHFYVQVSDGTFVVDAANHLRAWHNLADSVDCAKSEAERAAESMKAANPSWTVYGPDGNEIR